MTDEIIDACHKMMTALIPRTHYASLSEGVYLNQASLGLLGQPAVEAMHRFVDDVARHGNLHMSDADEVGFFDRLRERAARLFRADRDRIAIVSSTSELLGQIPLLVPSIAGLTAALDQLLNLGEARIEAHARRLAEMLIEKASRNGWQPFRDLSDRAASPHIISLMRPGKELDATQDALRRANVACSSRGGRVRVSLAPYNDESDIDSLVAALG